MSLRKPLAGMISGEGPKALEKVAHDAATEAAEKVYGRFTKREVEEYIMQQLVSDNVAGREGKIQIMTPFASEGALREELKQTQAMLERTQAFNEDLTTRCAALESELGKAQGAELYKLAQEIQRKLSDLKTVNQAQAERIAALEAENILLKEKG